MAIRAYFVQVVPPSGTSPITNSYRPADMLVIPGLRSELSIDGRSVMTGSGAGQEFFRLLDVTPAQHALLVADARITYLPTETAGGLLVGLAEPLSAISAANRTLVRQALEARHIPDDGLSASDPLRALYLRIARRLLVRDILRTDDLSEGLDTLVSAIPVARRQAIRAKLVAQELDFDTVQGSDTVREAIRKVVTQNAGALRSLS